MGKEKIKDYIEKARKRGASDSAIRRKLKSSGYSENSIDSVLGPKKSRPMPKNLYIAAGALVIVVLIALMIVFRPSVLEDITKGRPDFLKRRAELVELDCRQQDLTWMDQNIENQKAVCRAIAMNDNNYCPEISANECTAIIRFISAITQGSDCSDVQPPFNVLCNAALEQDSTACDQITNASLKSWCLALSTNEYRRCGPVHDQVLCISTVALSQTLKQGDINACKDAYHKIPEEILTTIEPALVHPIVSMCRAAISGDATECAPLSLNFKNSLCDYYYYLGAADYYDDSSHCENIKNINYENLCRVRNDWKLERLGIMPEE